MARDYVPNDDYSEDDQLLAEAAYQRACEEAADEAAWRRDMASEELGPWPTDAEIAEYEEYIRRVR